MAGHRGFEPLIFAVTEQRNNLYPNIPFYVKASQLRVSLRSPGGLTSLIN